MTDNIGHNKPPFDAEEWAKKAKHEMVPEFARVYELLSRLGIACATLGAGIENKEQADRLADFNKQLMAASKAIDLRRKEMTGPLNEQVKSINSEHKPFAELCLSSRKTLSSVYLMPWQLKEEKRIAEEQAKAEAEKRKAEELAAEAERRAEQLKQTAGSGEEATAAIAAEFEANQAKEVAKAAKKEASAAKKQTAAAGSTNTEGRRSSLRTNYTPEITDFQVLFQKFGLNDTHVQTALISLANSICRSPDKREVVQKRIEDGEDVGFKIVSERKVI